MLPSSDPHLLRLPTPEWDQIRQSVPIVCADIVIIREMPGGVTEVALGRREYRDGTPRWCHVGGRVGLDERLRVAALRHLRESIDLQEPEHARIAANLPAHPTAYVEFMRTQDTASADTGLDADKHAVSWCFRLAWPGEVGLRPAAAAEVGEIRWFPITGLPSDLWPGTALTISRILSAEFAPETYAAVSSDMNTHNALMWQTPALAMTAQAFLLTIALGAGVAPPARAAAGMLGLLVSVLSIQLMMKHSAMQLRDARKLEQLERMRGMDVHHVKPEFSARGLTGWLTRQPSRTWWLVGMGAFGLVALGTCLAGIAGMVR